MKLSRKERMKLCELVAEYLTEKCKWITQEDRDTVTDYFLDHPELWRD